VDSLAGKVAVVTGGASGIGLALARQFAAEGASVVLADVAVEALTVVAEELATSTGVDVLAVPTDVSDPQAVDELAQKTMDRFGHVHVVCNNAGIVVTGKAWEVSLEDWQRLMGVNLWGVIHGIRSFVPILIAQGEPAYVVNTASMAGVTSLPALAPYVASKHAVVALSEVLHHDLAQAGAPVKVTVVCPGVVVTHLGQADKLAPLPATGPGARSADQVAELVRAAMAEGRFYVFTHGGSTDDVETRLGAIVEGRTPALRPLPLRPD
jgi:NAD(P)-dependent dehydrogenase (short-subunit alcohol dehydrogenase family)